MMEIESELQEPRDLLDLIQVFEQNKYCIDCQTSGHLMWDIIRKAALNQMYVCGDCPDALALVEFAHDMVRVLKQGLAPRYPKNFQYWIDKLAPLQTALADSLHDIQISDKMMEQIKRIKDKKIEFSFCSSRPGDLRGGGKANVEVPSPCTNKVIVHNHPSGSTNMSEQDKQKACENKSIMCVVTPGMTKCYAPCTNEVVKEIKHG